MNILHISTHLGGGVGRFICNTFSNDNLHNHTFVLLEKPVDLHLLGANSIDWRVLDELPVPLHRLTEQYDLVQIEFWNHPLLLKYLHSTSLIDCRIIAYCHVSGLYPPNIIPKELIDYCDWMVFSTPATVEDNKTSGIFNNYTVIHSLGGISRTKDVSPKPHSEINVSYIGTANFSKLHEDYINICKRILNRNRDIHFHFASNDSCDHLHVAARASCVDDSITFHTRLLDIRPILEVSDIFGYPLRSDHFGTGEQAIQEAMGAGIPPVVLDNPAERCLIQDGKTGLIANSIEEYILAINYLAENPIFRRKLGVQAKEFAELNFSERNTLSRFHVLYNQVAEYPRSDHHFCMPQSESPADTTRGWELFKLCLGENSIVCQYEACKDEDEKRYILSKIKKSLALVSNVKGGLHHYLKYFPNDSKLLKIARLISEPTM